LLAWPASAAADVGPERFLSEHANLTFGAALAGDGSRLAVGAPGANDVGFDAGAVYVYGRDRGEWVLRQRLEPDTGPYQHFGSALALDGDTLLVAGEAPLATGGATGVAHLYEVEHGELVARERWVLDEQASLGYLGLAVAVDGDTLAFGGYLAQTTATVPGGRVRVMRRAGGQWVEEADLGGGELLGATLAIDGDWLFVQADYGERVAIYRRDAGGVWQAQPDLELAGAEGPIEAATIVSDDGALVIADRVSPVLHFYGPGAGGWQRVDTRSYVGDMYSEGYGEALAIGDGRVAYTSTVQTYEPAFSHVDTIHVLRRDGDAWVDDGEVERDARSDVHEAFGARLALAGGTLLAGAPEYGDPGYERSGQVHVFARDGGWEARQILGPDDVLGGDGCGCRGGVAPGWYALLLVWPRRRRRP
jgi:hypothetical protein